MSETSGPISDGVRAAALLEEACRSAQGSLKAQRIEVVRELALDLGRQLEALSDLAREDATPDVLTEAAISCADLANLAACNVPDLPLDAAEALGAGRGSAPAREYADGEVSATRVGLSDFVPNQDDYLRRIAEAARRILAGGESGRVF